jgi:predicted dinucleotide-binding enzyme
MKIGILGSGDVAKTLAKGFIEHGYAVMVGSRSPGKLAEWAATYPTIKLGTFSETAAYAELVVLSVKGTVALEALALAGAENLKHKAVIDTTNPIADKPPVNGVLQYFTTFDSSLMERLQNTFSDSYFVKAFNSVGSANMVNPQFSGGMPTMFICGNSLAAKLQVSTVLTQFGWEVADYGGVEAARAIEPLCMLWCIPGFLHNDWSHAFKMLK